jgi:hypothetical protein
VRQRRAGRDDQVARPLGSPGAHVAGDERQGAAGIIVELGLLALRLVQHRPLRFESDDLDAPRCSGPSQRHRHPAAAGGELDHALRLPVDQQAQVELDVLIVALVLQIVVTRPFVDRVHGPG